MSVLALALFFFLPLLFLIHKFSGGNSNNTNNGNEVPKSYPIIGSFFAIRNNYSNRLQWFTSLLRNSPTSTISMHHSPGRHFIMTANPAVVQHILKTNFSTYQKGPSFRTTLHDFLGDGIFNADGDTWKFQRQVSSHQFNTKSLKKFVADVVDSELYERLIPILTASAEKSTVLDFQDILQRFAFDNICRIGFGYDPEYLLPSLPQAKFAVAFDDAVQISGERFGSLNAVWRLKRAFGIGSEKRLRRVIADVREFAETIVRQKKEMKVTAESQQDLLSRFLSSGHSDEKFVTDIVISFTLAGRDTTSAALTWFFWLVANHPEVEDEILKEISKSKSSPENDGVSFEEAKEMVYTHAALCESMRLYPPVPTDSKEAVNDDVLPDGTIVKKGMRVVYHVYAMGRMERIWGKDWAEFKPERWLEREEDRWRFVGKDSYSYPVFQAGPRICLGKEMAFLQMKRVVAGVLKRFKVVPENKKEPEFLPYLTAKMKDGLPVTVVERTS